MFKKLFFKCLSFVLVLATLSSNTILISAGEKDIRVSANNPYVELFNKYVNETGLDVVIENEELFYNSYKDLTLEEWDEKLESRFIEFKELLIETEKEIIIESTYSNKKGRLIEPDGKPGVSLSERNIYIVPFSDPVFPFENSFSAIIASKYRYLIPVSGLVRERNPKTLFNTSWQAWEYA